MPSAWKSIRHRVEWCLLKALSVIVPCLPRGLIRGIAKGLGFVACHVDRRGRETALQNLELVFGGDRSEKERRRMARRAFQSFAQMVMDQFWSPRLKADTYERYCELVMEDPEAIEQARDRGAIWVTPHYANFEWTALAMGFKGYPFTVVAQEFRNPLLTDIFKANREVSGHQVIPQRRAMVRLLKSLHKGGHAAFLTDLAAPPSKAATVIRCFGRKTCVTALHAILAKRTGLPIVPGMCFPRGDGTYELHGFKPLEISSEATESEIAQACWDVFEPHVRANPEPWLWMYKHWRFLPADTEGVRYPPCAHASKRFEKVEAAAAYAAQRAHEMDGAES